MTDVDAFTLAMLGNRLDGIAEEMGLGLVRSSHSMLIRNALDFTTAICDPHGGLVALGPGIPMNLSAVTDACQQAITKTADWAMGDIVLLNDPYSGGTHLNDFFMVSPVLAPESAALVGFVVVAAHMTDVGGIVPGSMSYEASEIHQEGLRIPPLFLRRGNRMDEALTSLIRQNVRYRDEVWADVEAMITAIDSGARELHEVVADVGAENLAAGIAGLNEQSAQAVGRWLATLGAEPASFTDRIDPRGRFPGAMIRVTAAADRAVLVLDFAGTSPQVRNAVNSPLSFTRSCASVAVRCAMADTVRLNQGFLSRIQVRAEEGSLVHAKLPASCGHRGITGYRVFDTVLGALAGLGAVARAAGEGGTMSCMLEGHNAAGTAFAARFAFLGSWGASAEDDGVEGITNPCANLANIPVELLEQRYPLRFHRYGFVPDSEGAGQFRGGLASEAIFEFIGDTGSIDIRCDRTVTAPYGIGGGESGGTASAGLTRDGVRMDLNETGRTALQHGDEIHLVLASGGGYGDPRRRDPDAVRADLRAGKISPARAHQVYGLSREAGDQ